MTVATAMKTRIAQCAGHPTPFPMCHRQVVIRQALQPLHKLRSPSPYSSPSSHITGRRPSSLDGWISLFEACHWPKPMAHNLSPFRQCHARVPVSTRTSNTERAAPVDHSATYVAFSAFACGLTSTGAVVRTGLSSRSRSTPYFCWTYSRTA